MSPSVPCPGSAPHSVTGGRGQRGHQIVPRATPLPGRMSHAWGRLRNGAPTSGALVLCLPAPQPHKTSPRRNCGKNCVHCGDVTFPRSHIWAGHPCSYHCQPQKGGWGGEGVWKCKNQHCFGENSFFQRCGAVKEAQPAGNSSPGESSCPSLSLLLLQGGLGTKNLLGTASCSLPSCAAGTGAQLAPGCILGFPPPPQPHSTGDTDRGLCHCWSWHWSSHQGVGKVALQWDWAAPDVGVQLPPCSASHCALGCALSSPNPAAGTDPAWPTAPRQGRAVELRHGRCPGEEGLRRREGRWP